MPFFHEFGAMVLIMGTCHISVQDFTPEHNTHPLRISHTQVFLHSLQGTACMVVQQAGAGGLLSSYVDYADFMAALVGSFDSLSLGFFVCGVEKMAVPKL